MEWTGMTKRTDDYDAIVRVVQLYIDGFNQNDAGKFREAFHPDAWIFYVDAEGKTHANKISDNFEQWASRPSPGVAGRFVSVTQVGDAASVQLSFDAEKAWGWIDFHNLLRVDGVWESTSRSAADGGR